MKNRFFEIAFAAEDGGSDGTAPLGGDPPAVSAAGQGDQTANDGLAPAAMPEGLPAQFWDDKSGAPKMADFVASYNELVQVKEAHDARLASVPKTADEYKLEIKLPDDVKLPEGLTREDLKIDDKDPRIPVLREFALKHQLSNEAVNELVALDAQTQIAALTQHDELLQAEMRKLGENGKERVSAMEAFLQKHVPAEYEAMRPFIGDASAFAGLEKLITKITSETSVPGGAPPRVVRAVDVPVEQRWYNGQQKAN